MSGNKWRKWLVAIAAVGTSVTGVYAALAQSPSIVGERIAVTSGPGSHGNIVGEQINVTAGPGAQGSVIGKQIVVNVGGAQQGPRIGNDSTVVGTLPPGAVVGDRSTVVGATDANGYTILNRGGTAIGNCAHADATSIAIGENAGAGAVGGCLSPQRR